jgi:hypothetical protein
MPNPKYFDYFPTNVVEIDGIKRTITDIARAVIPNLKSLEKVVLFYDYTVSDGQRPDHVAFEQYGDTAYYWIVLVVNRIHNIYEEWPLSTQQFKNYIIDKYGSISVAQVQVAAYRNKQNGILVSSDVFAQNPSIHEQISVYQFEDELNESKRRIKLVRQQYLQTMKNEINTIFEG